jgi:peptidoglycan biosynthesis protein MviN/MurJ (putative lipid II flippase)
MSGFGAGIITSLNYAQQISDAPNKFAIQQFSVVSGIKFNELHASSNSKNELNSTFIRVSDFLLFFMFPISSFLFFFTDSIVELIFGYTKVNPENLHNIALLLIYLGLLSPFVVINTMISRLFMAAHKIKESYWYQVAMNALFIPMLFLFVHQLGIVGYPVAILIFHCINVIAIFFLSKMFFKFLNYKKILEKFCVLLLLNLFIGTVTFYSLSFIPNIEKIVLGLLLYAALLLLLNQLFKINEFVYDQTAKYLHRTKMRLSKFISS